MFLTRLTRFFALRCLWRPGVGFFRFRYEAPLVCPILFGPPFRSGWLVRTSGHFAVDCCLATLLGVCLLLLPFWGRLFSGGRLSRWQLGKLGRRGRVVLGVAILGLAILTHLVRYNGPLATVVACRELYEKKQWDALLEMTRQDRSGDLLLQFMTNSALSHQGRLLDEMFNYPQDWGTRGLVLNFSGIAQTAEEDDSYVAMYNSDLFFELGHANAAFRHAYGSMRTWGTTYDGLKRIAECSIVNGNEAMAMKYLNVLEKTLFHRDFAERHKAILADREATEREFGDLRRRLPRVSQNMLAHPTTPLLTLIESNPQNRMALDYLTAWFLLDKTEDSLETIFSSVGCFRNAGYGSLPTHCEEALLLWEGTGRGAVDRQGLGRDVACGARFDEFRRTLAKHAESDEAPEAARAMHGDTYWFYYFFVITPAQEHPASQTGRGFGGTSRVE